MNGLAIQFPREPVPAATSLGAATLQLWPFRRLLLRRTLPTGVAAALAELASVAAPELPVLGCATEGAVFTRRLWPTETQAPACSRAAVSTFTAPHMIDVLQRGLGVDLAGCRLRLSLQHAVDGYAAEPRTAEDEACVRVIVALAPCCAGDLGVDLYVDAETWAAQTPWSAGLGVAFAPGGATWHGFEPRLIRRDRTALIVDYVAAEPLLRACREP